MYSQTGNFFFESSMVSVDIYNVIIRFKLVQQCVIYCSSIPLTHLEWKEKNNNCVNKLDNKRENGWFQNEYERNIKKK